MTRFGILLFCLFAGLTASAQWNNDPYANNGNRGRGLRNHRAPSLSAGLQVMQPVGEFARNIDGPQVGFSGLFLVNQRQSPFEFGVEVAWAGIGRDHQDVVLDLGTDTENNTIYQDARIRLRGNMYQYHGIARLKPFAGRIQPYGDLMLGAKYFSLRSSIQEEYDGVRETVEANREEGSMAVSYGWACGLKIRLNRAMMLEARFEKLTGGQAEFADADSIEIDPEGNYTYEMVESRTSSWNYHVGVSFEF